MTSADVLSIVIPTVGLLVLAVPGGPRWTRRPSFVGRPLTRRSLALIFGALLFVALVHALV